MTLADREMMEIGALVEELAVILDAGVDEVLDALEKAELLSAAEVNEILDEGDF